jgi:hypothetical protein
MSLIKGKQIAANSVTLSKLTTIGAAQLLVGAVDGQITAVTLSSHATISASGALTLADDSVSTSKILNSAVTTAKIADDAVTLTKIDSSAFATDFTAATLSGFIAEAAAVKSYVDSVAQGLDVKESVKAATTSSADLYSFSYSSGVLTETTPTLSTLELDGVSLSLGDRILVKDNNMDASQNGIYEVTQEGNASSTPWILSRVADLATGFFAAGAFVFVESGTTLADTGWVCSSNSGSDTVGTNNLSFTQFSSAGIIEAGSGLVKTGNSIAIDIDSLFETTTLESTDLFLVSDAGYERKVTKSSLVSSLISGETLKATSSQLEAAMPRLDVLSLAGAVAATASTTLALSKTPAADQHPLVFVNGLKVKLGGSGDAGVDAYFKSSDGATSRASLSNLVSGDILWWASSSYDLEAGDLLEISYTAFE